ASAQIRDDLDDQVKRSVAAGAKVLLGGKPQSGDGFFFDPTVLEVDRKSPAFREETFGPLAAVIRAQDLDDAIAIANDSRFGLGSAAWTRDEAEIERFARDIQAGTVFINGMMASDPRFPFGGVKKSGYGRELSDIGMHEFVNVKTVRILGGTHTETATE
ncbi:MAG TPA: aldehyde dehydrogenase family protein, partial [Gemmatimonadaceae bacterium]